jgi:hypothetical protein
MCEEGEDDDDDEFRVLLNDAKDRIAEVISQTSS